MGGVLGKRPRVAAAPDTVDAGGVPDHTDEAGLDEKVLSSRAVAHVEVQPIDARSQRNGDCPGGADLTQVEARGGLAVQSVDVGATGGAGSSGQQQEDDDDDDDNDEEVVEEHGTFSIDQLQGKEVTPIKNGAGKVAKCADIGTNMKGCEATYAEAKPENEVTPINNGTGKAANKCFDNGIDMKGSEARPSKNCAEKKSMLTIAAEESDEAMDRVMKLYSSAMQLKTHYPNKPKKTKQEYWRSASADTTALAKIVQNAKDREENSIKITTRLARIQFCQKLPSAKVVTSRPNAATNYRSPGWDLIEWEGCFAVPTDSFSGNPFVDEMNIILFGLMMSVTQLLEGGQILNSLAEICGECKKTEADRCAAIRKLRNTCKSIRAVILNLGCLPLKEPVDFWRKKFHLVKF